MIEVCGPRIGSRLFGYVVCYCFVRIDYDILSCEGLCLML